MTSLDIIADVAERTGISVTAILGRGRTRAVADARAQAMAEVRHRLHLSYPEIGRVFDRDHTTVIQAVRRIGLPESEARIVKARVDLSALAGHRLAVG